MPANTIPEAQLCAADILRLNAAWCSAEPFLAAQVSARSDLRFAACGGLAPNTLLRVSELLAGRLSPDYAPCIVHDGAVLPLSGFDVRWDYTPSEWAELRAHGVPTRVLQRLRESGAADETERQLVRLFLGALGVTGQPMREVQSRVKTALNATLLYDALVEGRGSTARAAELLGLPGSRVSEMKQALPHVVDAALRRVDDGAAAE